ncbi:MAG: hypothetical protein ACKV22_31860 [Bryobacteraceae bacterium]
MIEGYRPDAWAQANTNIAQEWAPTEALHQPFAGGESLARLEGNHFHVVDGFDYVLELVIGAPGSQVVDPPQADDTSPPPY